MPKNKKMTPPPPPSRTSNKASFSVSSDLADELDETNFFASSATGTSISHKLKPSRMKKSSSSASTNSSTSTSAVSNVSNFSFSDDFTLGSRTKSQQAPSQQGGYNRHDHTTHSHSHGHGHGSRRASHPHNYHRPKERYVFSNFRFLVNESFPLPISVDEPFDWLSIEMVLVPEIENVLCPICLDVPCIPRFTRCGHIYCLPCLLQFFQTSEPSSEGLGNNWRTCPVCAEPLHLKQLRPVKFCPATEPQEGEIFHSVLIQKAVGSLRPHLPRFSNDSLATLSPFQRLIPISKSFVLNEIINPDINALRTEIKNRKLFGEESLEMSFFEASIKLLEDQRKLLLEESKKPTVSVGLAGSATTAPHQDCYYFHQSRDGLNIFLHPLCMKILKHHFTTYDCIPRDLSLPILQLERVLVNSSNRKRFKYLDHLSLGTQIILVEVDLKSIVSDATLQAHSKELANRQDIRDHKLTTTIVVKDRSIIEEWKQMEDDYYSISQATAAMDIKVPESVKLDDLDDETSFPLPSSFNGTSNSNNGIPITPTTTFKKSPAIGISVGSPSFSALAHSLNSPFTFSSTVNFSNDALFSSSPPTTTPSWVNTADLSTSPTSTANTSDTSNGKKKIVLFSSGLNVKQR